MNLIIKLVVAAIANFLIQCNVVNAQIPIDPQASVLLQQIAKDNVDAPAPAKDDREWVVAARESYLAMVPLAGQPESVELIYDTSIKGDDGDIPLRIYDATESKSEAVIIYLHGGGFTAGSFATHDTPLRSLANRAAATVVAVDYRLAPEHPFPAALDDAYAALEWVYKNAGELEVNPDKIVVAGDSAGGNLAAALALMARDREGPTVALQLLIYPNTDLTLDRRHASIAEHEGKIITRDYIDRNIELYIEDAATRKSPYASPIFAESLSKLPVTHLITAGADPLRDEAELYAKNLRAAGVKVTHTQYPGMIHGFFQMGGVIDAGEKAINEAASAIKLVSKQ